MNATDVLSLLGRKEINGMSLEDILPLAEKGFVQVLEPDQYGHMADLKRLYQKYKPQLDRWRKQVNQHNQNHESTFRTIGKYVFFDWKCLEDERKEAETLKGNYLEMMTKYEAVVAELRDKYGYWMLERRDHAILDPDIRRDIWLEMDDITASNGRGFYIGFHNVDGKYVRLTYSGIAELTHHD